MHDSLFRSSCSLVSEGFVRFLGLVLVLVLMLAHDAKEKMLEYDAVSNIFVLCCCAKIAVLMKSSGENIQARAEQKRLTPLRSNTMIPSISTRTSYGRESAAGRRGLE